MPQFSIVFPKTTTYYLNLKKKILKIGCFYAEIFYFEK